MRIQVNDIDLFQIEDWEKELLAHDLLKSQLEEDLKRRLEWVIRHKIDQSYDRFEKKWLPVLREDPSVESIPKSKKEFVQVVINRPDYKDREQRDAETVPLSS